MLSEHKERYAYGANLCNTDTRAPVRVIGIVVDFHSEFAQSRVGDLKILNLYDQVGRSRRCTVDDLDGPQRREVRCTRTAAVSPAMTTLEAESVEDAAECRTF